MMRTLLVLSLLVLLVPASAPAAQGQRPSAFTQRKAMRQVEFLVGTWAGEGWIQMGPQRTEFRGHETVQKKLGGTVLLIEGEHKASMPGVEGEVTVHHALAVISWDREAGHFRFRSWLADGREGDYEARVESGVMKWFITHPERGTMRYTIRIDEQGRWHEIGEMNPRGTDDWHQFFEMTLRRVSD